MKVLAECEIIEESILAMRLSSKTAFACLESACGSKYKNRIGFNALKSVGLLSAALVTFGKASAAELAVEDKTPSNPDFIMSIPDCEAAWNSFSSSTLGRLIADSLGGFQLMDSQDLERVEKELGFTFTVENLFQETIRGFDMYLTSVNDASSFVINIDFKEEGVPDRVLDLIRTEVASARGNMAGVSADTIGFGQEGDRRLLSLPAFEVYLAAEGSELTWSNYRVTLDSALDNEGEATFNSDYFQRSMGALDAEKTDLWFFGEASQLNYVVYDMLSASTEAPIPYEINLFSDTSMATTIGFDESSWKMTRFIHQNDMDMASRRYAMTAPPAGEINIYDYFPADSIVSYGTNHFDGLALLEFVLSSLNEQPNLPVSTETIENAIKSSRSTLGFDLKSDILANLGPDLGFSISMVQGLKGTEPRNAFLFASGLKNPDRFNSAMEIILGSAEAMAETRNLDTEPYVKETYNGETIYFLESENLYNTSTNHAFSMTSDGFLLISNSVKSIKNSLDTIQGTMDGVMSQPDVRTARNIGEPNINSFFAVRKSEGFMDAMNEFNQQLGRSLSPDEELVKKFFEAINSVSSSSVYFNNGKKTELIISLPN